MKAPKGDDAQRAGLSQPELRVEVRARQRAGASVRVRCVYCSRRDNNKQDDDDKEEEEEESIFWCKRSVFEKATMDAHKEKNAVIFFA